MIIDLIYWLNNLIIIFILWLIEFYSFFLKNYLFFHIDMYLIVFVIDFFVLWIFYVLKFFSIINTIVTKLNRLVILIYLWYFQAQTIISLIYVENVFLIYGNLKIFFSDFNYVTLNFVLYSFIFIFCSPSHIQKSVYNIHFFRNSKWSFVVGGYQIWISGVYK